MKLLVITRCSACPFFEDSPLKGLFGIFTQALLADSPHGICSLLPSGEHLPSTDIKIGLPPGPEREVEEPRYAKARSRLVVPDKRTTPEECPLKQADVTITRTSEN